MSHILSTKTPALRQAARRCIARPTAHAYHSSASPGMPPGAAPINTLFRHTALRATAIAAQRTSFPVSWPFPHSAGPTHDHSHRSRTPSPPPPYQARSITVLAASNQWTRFTTPNNTLSSVRTFASSPRIRWPADGSAPSLGAQSQKAVEEAIEEIQDRYGAAKDEFDIAFEETEKNSTYAADDRAAAREELERLLDYFQRVMQDEDRSVAEEVKRRVGGRVRELSAAVTALEEAATHHS